MSKQFNSYTTVLSSWDKKALKLKISFTNISVLDNLTLYKNTSVNNYMLYDVHERNNKIEATFVWKSKFKWK